MRLKLSDKATIAATIVLGATCALAALARMIFPEIQPVLADMRVIFYLMLAVTVIALLRNVLGLITYGVFGPAIISLGLTLIGDVLVGFAVLFSVMGVGLLTRFTLEPLRLQITHRLAVVLIAVSATIGILRFAGLSLGDQALTLAGFIPIIISTWIVERFVRDTSESGWKISSRRLAYTLAAVIVSFALISENTLMTLFVNTPEAWILPVALNILIGANIRVRLSEYFRFKRLAKTHGPGGGGFSKVLTLNRRNRDYIETYNPRNVYPRMTKLRVKEALQKAGIPGPKTLAVIENYRDLKDLEHTLSGLPPGGFVIKPDNGFGGRGVTLITRKQGNAFEKANGEQLTLADIKRELEVMIDGESSGRWLPDRCLVEELIVADPKISQLSFSGLPDIRVIVFNGVPAMAMTRLPTKRSGGRANLRLGAVGAGIDLATGKITHAITGHEKKPITHHPDNDAPLIGATIPYWDQVIRLAVTAQKATWLGYAGVDIVIDIERGPLVMEVNKRPGLEIQNANNQPLLEKLQSIETSHFTRADTEFFLQPENSSTAKVPEEPQ